MKKNEANTVMVGSLCIQTQLYRRLHTQKAHGRTHMEYS